MDLENEAITAVIDSVLKCLIFQNEKYSITEIASYCIINQVGDTCITVISGGSRRSPPLKKE